MKTISLKKVSAVAVASLGFGLLSVVPANASYVTATITSINLKLYTSAPTAGSAVAVNFGVVAPAQTITGGDSIRFQAAMTTVPSGGSKSVTAAITTAAGAAGVVVATATETAARVATQVATAQRQQQAATTMATATTKAAVANSAKK